MRLRTITLWSRIDANGELKIPVEKLSAFTAMHPRKGVVIRIQVQSIEPTERMTNYFFGYVVKEMARAYESIGESLTNAQTYDKIRENCPIFLEEIRENGHWRTRAKEWEELSIEEAVEAISWVQRWASIEFQWVIDDAQ